MKIINKEILTRGQAVKVIKLDVLSGDIALKAQAGQFVVVMVSEEGERIPLTIVDANKDKGIIVLIFQELGLTTRLLGKLNVGDSLYSITGPLGRPTEIKNYGKVILVGGGVGIAEIYPVAKSLKKSGNYTVTVLGTRTKELLILENELKSASDEIHIVTDDGSYGKKGFTTDILEGLLQKQNYDLIYVVGPIPMMKRASQVAEKFNAKILVSLNALMVDATGMCGSCRVSVGGEVKFSCVDGPEFDGRKVDWDELTRRSNIYRDKEEHICKLNNLL